MRTHFFSQVTDNISEMLVKILEFTHIRHKVLAENIGSAGEPGFVPKDLAVQEFAQMMAGAIEEHRRSGRIILRDSQNIRFGYNGSFKVDPIVDERAKELFESDIAGYLDLQMAKITENLLNQRIAAELLVEKRTACVVMGN